MDLGAIQSVLMVLGQTLNGKKAKAQESFKKLKDYINKRNYRCDVGV